MAFKFPHEFPRFTPEPCSEYSVYVKGWFHAPYYSKGDMVTMYWDGSDWWWTGDDGSEKFTHMVTHFWAKKSRISRGPT